MGVRVATPDGTFEFDTQEKADAYQKAAGISQKSLPSTVSSTGADYAQAAKRGVTRGLMNNADMAVDMADGPAAVTLMGGVPMIIKALMEKGGEKFHPGDRMLSALGLDKKPQGAGAHYLEEGTAGGLGALTSGGKPGPSVVSGVAGGLGGQAAADLTGDNPISRVVGSLLSSLGGYGGYSALTGSRAKTRINTLAKDIPDSTFDEMKEGVKNAKEQGITIAANQATSQRTPLTVAAQDVAGSTVAGPKQGLNLEAQSGQAKTAAERLLGMMGGVKDPTEAAHGAQKAATKAIDAADKDLSKAVQPMYETDLNKLKDFVARKTTLAKSIFAESDPATEHGAALKALGKAVQKAENPEQLNSIYNEWNQGLQQNRIGNKSYVDFSAGEIRNKGLGKLDRFLDTVQVDRKKAQDEFQYRTSREIDPLRRSPVGRLAGKQGVIEDAPTATARILKVLDGPDVRAETILATQKTLDAQAPGSFAKLAAAAFEKKVEAAFKGREGQTPFDAPAELAQAVWGGPKQTGARENFRATMAGVARSNGLAGTQEAEFVKGAEKIMQAIEAAGREKTVTSIPHSKSAAVETVKGAVGSAIYTPQAPGAVARSMEAMTGGRAAKHLYELLWSGPEGVETIRKYARMSIPEIRAAGLAGASAAAYEQSHAQEK